LVAGFKTLTPDLRLEGRDNQERKRHNV